MNADVDATNIQTYLTCAFRNLCWNFDRASLNNMIAIAVSIALQQNRTAPPVNLGYHNSETWPKRPISHTKSSAAGIPKPHNPIHSPSLSNTDVRRCWHQHYLQDIQLWPRAIETHPGTRASDRPRTQTAGRGNKPTISMSIFFAVAAHYCWYTQSHKRLIVPS